MRLICQRDKLAPHRYLETIIILGIKMNIQKELLQLLLETLERQECSLLALVRVKLKIMKKQIHSYKFRIQLSIHKFKAKLLFQFHIMKENSFPDLVKSDSLKKIYSKPQTFINNLISMEIYIKIDYIQRQVSTKLSLIKIKANMNKRWKTNQMNNSE